MMMTAFFVIARNTTGDRRKMPAMQAEDETTRQEDFQRFPGPFQPCLCTLIRLDIMNLSDKSKKNKGP
ncbi:conserved hypothetical protein [Ricinus communis]|uniref:Uncharacterized protein n=1 Tax=Ricinus communis TaxID=3988 RepID=B9T3R9_RICCO|nr:conserved hypothetical protein [Ricinus communis]